MIFENRPFGIQRRATVPYPPAALASRTYQVDGETVVEAIFGHSGNIVPDGGPATAPGPTAPCCLRWFRPQPDPVVKAGDWIADVTYERQQHRSSTTDS